MLPISLLSYSLCSYHILYACRYSDSVLQPTAFFHALQKAVSQCVVLCWFTRATVETSRPSTSAATGSTWPPALMTAPCGYGASRTSWTGNTSVCGPTWTWTPPPWSASVPTQGSLYTNKPPAHLLSHPHLLIRGRVAGAAAPGGGPRLPFPGPH